jgi:hypothetical protein
MARAKKKALTPKELDELLNLNERLARDEQEFEMSKRRYQAHLAALMRKYKATDGTYQVNFWSGEIEEAQQAPEVPDGAV